MNRNLNLLSKVMSCAVAFITISIAIFAWIYVLQVVAKSGIYGVGNVDAVDFFISSNFAHIGYDAYMTMAALSLSLAFWKSFIFFCFVVILCTIMLVLIFKLFVENKIFYIKYRKFIIAIMLLPAIFLIFITVFLFNVEVVLKNIQYNTAHKSVNNTYCNILLSNNSESQILRINIDGNYKIVWTHGGLSKVQLDNERVLYLNKLIESQRNNLKNNFCL